MERILSLRHVVNVRPNLKKETNKNKYRNTKDKYTENSVAKAKELDISHKSQKNTYRS